MSTLRNTSAPAKRAWPAPITPEYKLRRGTALVLVGTQGSGKSTLARLIAAAHGPYVEISADQLGARHTLNAALNTRPNTLVVEMDSWPLQPATVNRIKGLITQRETVLPPAKGRGGDPRVVRTPNLIFCTGSRDAIPLDEGDRRFVVIEL